MTIIINNKLEKEKAFLEDYDLIIKKINDYKEKDKFFCLRDLLTNEQEKDYYYIYRTKGILMSLVYFKLVSIEGVTNGKNNFIYKANVKIISK